MTLYNVTKDPDYLEKAKSVYAWSRDVFFDKEKGRIADNMHYHFQRQNGMDIESLSGRCRSGCRLRPQRDV